MIKSRLEKGKRFPTVLVPFYIANTIFVVLLITVSLFLGHDYTSFGGETLCNLFNCWLCNVYLDRAILKKIKEIVLKNHMIPNL